ncbi:MAG: hypothetical protein HON90_05860 [Halobacteriovoraceae bacterium]|nr:hypothetical protein [Halobacteriovoraceae bacterium]
MLNKEILPTFEEFSSAQFGRPTKYNREMSRKLYSFYFKPRIINPTNSTKQKLERFPTLEGFLVQECIGVTTFRRWLKSHPDFRATYDFCKMRAKDILIQNILEDQWKFRAANLIAVNYTDIKNIVESTKNENYVETVPLRQKGYDISQISKYCSTSVREKIASDN